MSKFMRDSNKIFLLLVWSSVLLTPQLHSAELSSEVFCDVAKKTGGKCIPFPSTGQDSALWINAFADVVFKVFTEVTASLPEVTVTTPPITTPTTTTTPVTTPSPFTTASVTTPSTSTTTPSTATPPVTATTSPTVTTLVTVTTPPAVTTPATATTSPTVTTPVTTTTPPAVTTPATVTTSPAVTTPVTATTSPAVTTPVTTTATTVSPSIQARVPTCQTNTPIIDSVCTGLDQEITTLEFGKNASVSHIMFGGQAINRGWISDSMFKKGTHLTGGVYTGIIINEGILENFEFRGRYIQGGILAGLIYNNSDDGCFGTVTLAAGTRIIGGKICSNSNITGDPNNPALLENVHILPYSHLKNVILGKNVTVDPTAVIETVQALPILETNSNTGQEFAGGIAVNENSFVLSTQQHLQDSVTIRGRMTVNPEDIGKVVSLVVLGAYWQSGVPTTTPPLGFYSADENTSIELWDQNPKNLLGFKSGVKLLPVQTIDIYVGHLVATGTLHIYFGYRLPNNQLVRPKPENKIEVVITD